LVLWAYVRGWTAGGPLGTFQISFVKNGAFHPNLQLVTWPGWGTNVFTQIGYQFVPPAYPAANYLTGADLALANTGFSLSVLATSGQVAGAGFNVNGAVMRVCFQDPYTPSATFVNVPLAFCEA